MIVTSMQLTISSRRDIAVLQKESSSLEGEEDVKSPTSVRICPFPVRFPVIICRTWLGLGGAVSG